MSLSQEFHTPSDRSTVMHSEVSQTHSAVYLSDSAHDAKAKLLNDALQDIDMGRFQVCLSTSRHNNSSDIIHSGIYSSWLDLVGLCEFSNVSVHFF